MASIVCVNSSYTELARKVLNAKNLIEIRIVISLHRWNLQVDVCIYLKFWLKY